MKIPKIIGYNYGEDKSAPIAHSKIRTGVLEPDILFSGGVINIYYNEYELQKDYYSIIYLSKHNYIKHYEHINKVGKYYADDLMHGKVFIAKLTSSKVLPYLANREDVDIWKFRKNRKVIYQYPLIYKYQLIG